MTILWQNAANWLKIMFFSRSRLSWRVSLCDTIDFNSSWMDYRMAASQKSAILHKGCPLNAMYNSCFCCLSMDFSIFCCPGTLYWLKMMLRSFRATRMSWYWRHYLNLIPYLVQNNLYLPPACLEWRWRQLKIVHSPVVAMQQHKNMSNVLIIAYFAQLFWLFHNIAFPAIVDDLGQLG